MDGFGQLKNPPKAPHTAHSLSRMTRLPEKAIEEMLDKSVRIGWLEVCDNPAPSCDQIAPSCDSKPAPSCLEGKGTEGKGTEGKRKNGAASPTSNPYSSDFDKFWEVFPSGRKNGKRDAWAKWQSIVGSRASPESVIAAAKAYAESPLGKSEFVKGPASWLNKGMYEDDPSEWKLDGKHKQNEKERLW
jgi:hypothetical protein